MNGRFLLDTSIVIACLSNEPSAVDRINDADEFFISSTVLGEMLYGAYNSTKVRGNVERINAFLSGAVLLMCDESTSHLYGVTKTELRRKGRPIPDNDIWIATSAKQYSLTLITRDHHFNEVDGLSVVRL